MPSAHIASASSPDVSPLGLILKEMLSLHSAEDGKSSHGVRRGAPQHNFAFLSLSAAPAERSA